jgi:hypothetical protein
MSDPVPPRGLVARDQTEELSLQQTHGWGGAVMLNNSPRVSYSRELLEVARSLLNREPFGLSIVVSQTACEVATENALAAAFASRGVPELKEPLSKLLRSYSMTNDNVRRVYTALTGRGIGDAPFWPAFKRANQKRHDIVHNGAIAMKTEAEDAWQAAKMFLDYLGQ